MWEFVVKQLFERLYFHFEFLTSYMSELKKEKKKKKERDIAIESTTSFNWCG